MKAQHKRNLNILKDSHKNLDRRVDSLLHQLTEEEQDEAINKRIKSSIEDIKICIKLYEDRLSKE
jgi:hypothetical protein